MRRSCQRQLKCPAQHCFSLTGLSGPGLQKNDGGLDPSVHVDERTSFEFSLKKDKNVSIKSQGIGAHRQFVGNVGIILITPNRTADKDSRTQRRGKLAAQPNRQLVLLVGSEKLRRASQGCPAWISRQGNDIPCIPQQRGRYFELLPVAQRSAHVTVNGRQMGLQRGEQLCMCTRLKAVSTANETATNLFQDERQPLAVTAAANHCVSHGHPVC